MGGAQELPIAAARVLQAAAGRGRAGARLQRVGGRGGRGARGGRLAGGGRAGRAAAAPRRLLPRLPRAPGRAGAGPPARARRQVRPPPAMSRSVLYCPDSVRRARPARLVRLTRVQLS